VAELPYPNYLVNAEGPSETGFAIRLHIQVGQGGPLAEQSVESVLAGLRTLLQAGDEQVSTTLTKFEITSTYS